MRKESLETQPLRNSICNMRIKVLKMSGVDGVEGISDHLKQNIKNSSKTSSQTTRENE